MRVQEEVDQTELKKVEEFYELIERLQQEYWNNPLKDAKDDE